MIRKTIFLSISVLVSEIVNFMSKKKNVLYEFPQKWFKITDRHSLAVCGTLWGEKQFLLIFIPFYWFEKKKLFKQILIFLSIYQFSNMVRKTNFLSKSILVYEIVTFLTKTKSSLRISPKCFKTTERHSLAVCGSFVEKNSFC